MILSTADLSQVLALRAVQIKADHAPIDWQGKHDRKEWVHGESLHRYASIFSLGFCLLREHTQSSNQRFNLSIRTTCVLFGIQRLFSPANGNGSCVGFAGVHLPCSRRLWEPVTDAEWTNRHQDEETRRTFEEKTLSIEHLQSPGSVDDHEDLGVAQLATWCEAADELGVLVWMAILSYT